MKYLKKALSLFLCLLMCITGPLISNALADGYGGNVSSGLTPTDGGDGGPPCIPCKICPDRTYGSADHRVYFYNGSEYLQETDLSLPGVMPIRIQRTYNSQATFDSPLGYGWDFSFNERLRTYDDNSVVIRKLTGIKLYFVFTGGRYVCEESPHLILLQNSDGSFVFYSSPIGIRLHYDRDGRLVRKQDINGNSLRMFYSDDIKSLIGISPNSIAPDTPMIVSNNHQLQRVEQWNSNDVFTGRSVDFSYDDSSGRLISITDSTGRTIHYQHDASGNLIRVDYPEELFESYQYTDSNDPHNMTNNLRGYGTNAPVLLVSREYDQEDRLVREERAGGILNIDYTIPLQKTKVSKTIVDSQGTTLPGRNTYYEFTADGFLLKTTDEQKSIEFVRDSRNNIIERILWKNTGSAQYPTLAKETSTNFIFDDDNLVTRSSIEIGNGEQIITKAFYDNGALKEKQVYSTSSPDIVHHDFFEYNYIGNIHTTIASIKTLVNKTPTPIYNSVAFEYDDTGQPLTVTFENGDRFTTEYENGLITNNDGITLSYDNRGQIVTSVDRNGNTTQYEYDNLGRITKIINALGAETILTYTGWQMTSIELGKDGEFPGQITNFVYDPYNRLLQSSVDLNGSPVRQTTYNYDSEGNVLSVTDQQGNSNRYSYDPWNRPLLVTDANENNSSYSYSFDGKLTSITNPFGNITSYAYDMQRRLTQITDSQGGITSFTLDKMGKATKVIDPEGREFTFGYDLVGRTIWQENQVTGRTLFSYDKRGRVNKIEYPDGLTKEYQYNRRSQLEQITLNGGTPDTTTLRYGYDNMGNLLWYADPAESVPLFTLSYDALNRLKTKTLNHISKTMQLDYTAQGQRQKLAILDNGTELFNYSYSYDNSGQLTALTESPLNNITNFSYDSRGFLTGKTYANEITAALSYSPSGQLTDLYYQKSDSTTINHYEYDFDNLDRIEAITDNHGTTTYSYDLLGRLKNVDYPDGSDLSDENYTYDLTGNRLTSTTPTTPPTTINWTYNDSGQLLAYNGHAINYDEKGRQISDTFDSETVSYSYDYLNRIDGASSTGMEATYSYDFANRRLKKTVNDSDTWFLYDGAKILAEFDNSGQLTRHYNSPPGSFDLLGITEGNNSYTSITNHLQAPQYVMNDGQTKIWQANYQSFGEALINNDVDNDTNPFILSQRFPGQYHDSETGQYYNWHRSYNPKTGRYTSPDPIGLAGGINLFEYVNGNPLSNIDPNGLIGKRWWAAGTGSIKVIGGGIALFVVATATVPVSAPAAGLAVLGGYVSMVVGGTEVLIAAAAPDESFDRDIKAMGTVEILLDPPKQVVFLVAVAAGTDCPKALATAQVVGMGLNIHSIATGDGLSALNTLQDNLGTVSDSISFLTDIEGTHDAIVQLIPSNQIPQIPLTPGKGNNVTLRFQRVTITPEFNYQEFLQRETLGRDFIFFNFPSKNGITINQY